MKCKETDQEFKPYALTIQKELIKVVRLRKKIKFVP
jgi:hypothetical protein